MKKTKQNTYKKEFVKLAEELGLTDETILAGYEDPLTKKPRFELTNNARRFVRGMLKLPLEEQFFRINRLKGIVAEQKLTDTKVAT